MKPLIYALPGHEAFAASLVRELGADGGEIMVRRFPDGESYVRLLTPPKDRAVIFVCGLDRPNEKSVELYFAASTARELGANRIGLVAPYLGYMRQDARFKPGEAITSVWFARWLSQYVDWLVTMDPHLHRHPSLDTIYSIPATVAGAAPAISHWIKAHVADPLVIGPDSESAQWVEHVAAGAGCPSIVLSKQRLGDHEVTISAPNLAGWRDKTPVLVDDIISTARTMIAAIARLRAAGMTRPPVCIGVHALFAGDAFAALGAAGVARIATCNTIAHASNAIDVVPEIVSAIRKVDIPVDSGAS